MDGQVGTERGWATWPNAVTAVRLALLPVYVYLVLATDHWAVAAWLLATLGATDWVDGFLARRWHQVSSVGKILDPVADRLLVMTGVLTIALVGAKRGKVAQIAKHVVAVDSEHYGRAEDTQMLICHLLCYAFMEKPELAN